MRTRKSANNFSTTWDPIFLWFARAVREMQYRPLSDQPAAVQTAYQHIMDFWRLHFDDFVSITSVLMIIACLSLRCFSMGQTAKNHRLPHLIGLRTSA